jgi:hypothetical protein
MSENQVFLPKRNPGLPIQITLVLIVIGGAGFLLYLVFQQSGGLNLILLLTGALILLALVPLLAYRAYALLHANYDLERNGLRIRWGLRTLDIPLSEVEWVRPAEDLQIPLKLPLFSLPGAVLGVSQHPDLGAVEFIASSAKNLVIVACMDRMVALSPDEDQEFVQKFNRTIEMGTLSPIQPQSLEPAVFLRSVFSDRLARVTIPSGFGLWFLLLILVSVMIPNRSNLSLGYDVAGLPLETVAASRLLILPVIGIFLYTICLIVGAYFYRKETTRPVSQMLWVGGILPSVLFLITTMFFIN